MRIISEVDAKAKSYWEDYFRDSGYGAQLVKDLPKRISAALKGGKFSPVGFASPAEDGSMTIEGLHTPPEPPTAKPRLVAIKLSAAGDVLGTDVLDLKAAE